EDHRQVGGGAGGQRARQAGARAQDRREQDGGQQRAGGEREEHVDLAAPGVRPHEPQRPSGPHHVAPAGGEALLVPAHERAQHGDRAHGADTTRAHARTQAPTGTESSSSRTTSSLSTPEYLALVSRARRWASVRVATALTSSGNA